MRLSKDKLLLIHQSKVAIFYCLPCLNESIITTTMRLSDLIITSVIVIAFLIDQHVHQHFSLLCFLIS